MSHCVDLGTLDKLRAHVGRQVFLTDWVAMPQERIDRFAQATEDFQWIHVDTERAAKSSPFGGTIAHGFLTLSLLGKFYESHLSLPFCEMGINYGLNKVRFTNPVRAGSRVRGRFVLGKLEDIDGGMQLRPKINQSCVGHGEIRGDSLRRMSTNTTKCVPPCNACCKRA